MSRLIREEDVLKIIRNGWSNHQSCKEMCDEIVCLPTAFDVEVVVKELEKMIGSLKDNKLSLALFHARDRDGRKKEIIDGKIYVLNQAIEIVRKGGVKNE